MLNARWKGGAPDGEKKPEALQAGQIRSFRIVKLDAEGKKIGRRDALRAVYCIVRYSRVGDRFRRRG